MNFLWLFGVISIFFDGLSNFLGPATILFRALINTDNRIFRVLLHPGILP